MANYTYTGNQDSSEKTEQLILRGGALIIKKGQYADLTTNEYNALKDRYVLVAGTSGTPAGSGTPGLYDLLSAAAVDELVAEVLASGSVASSTVAAISVTASRALALTDASQRLRVSSGSAVALTVPANATVAFSIGTVIEVFRLGAGAVTFTAAGGVTVNAVGLGISQQYGSAALVKVATNEWDLVGGLA